MNEAALAESMRELADGVRPWERGSFTAVRRLQEASRNHGRVDEMSYQGHHVAVKRMPNWWVQDDQRAFRRNHQHQLERPWVDLGIVAELQRAHYPYTCELIGIFRDDSCTYVVSSLASHGDMFSWAEKAPPPGLEREVVMRPLAVQLLDAVRLLHDLGISHRDISLENILTTRLDGDAEMQVRLIDFGMAGLGRWHPSLLNRTPGKPYYKAPELHEGVTYDAYLSDNFALGITLYAMALASYPWESTTPGKSPMFGLVREVGTMEFMRRKTIQGNRLPDVCTADLLQLIGGLLAVAPGDRTTVGEACFEPEGRTSALTSPWLPSIGDGEREDLESCQTALHGVMSAASLSTLASQGDDTDSTTAGSASRDDEECDSIVFASKSDEEDAGGPGPTSS
jgi:serine/threonine protein kinase